MRRCACGLLPASGETGGGSRSGASSERAAHVRGRIGHRQRRVPIGHGRCRGVVEHSACRPGCGESQRRRLRGVRELRRRVELRRRIRRRVRVGRKRGRRRRHRHLCEMRPLGRCRAHADAGRRGRYRLRVLRQGRRCRDGHGQPGGKRQARRVQDAPIRGRPFAHSLPDGGPVAVQGCG